MRFVAVKTEEQQARAMLFRTRDLLVRQRTQLINALRGQLSEHGVVAPQGPANVAILAQAIDDMTPSLPLLVVELARVYLDQIDGLSEKVAGLEKAIACEAKRGAMTRRRCCHTNLIPVARGLAGPLRLRPQCRLATSGMLRLGRRGACGEI
jgi:transposase